MYSTVLSERVRELKEMQEGVDVMCREMEKIYSEGEEIGIKAGEEQAKREMSLSLFQMGLSVEKIAEAARVSEK